MPCASLPFFFIRAEAARGPRGRHREQPEDSGRGERRAGDEASGFLGLDEGRLLGGGRGVHLLPVELINEECAILNGEERNKP